MSISLADALADVELESGRTYRCAVRGRRVELRVLPEPADERAAGVQSAVIGGIRDEDIRLDPWCDLPWPVSLSRVTPRTVTSLPLDIPEIPSDESPA